MLVTVEDHVFESPQSIRSKVAEHVRPAIVVQVVLVHAFKQNGELDTAFFRLLVENGKNLLAYVS
jgi:hypothetical protein